MAVFSNAIALMYFRHFGPPLGCYANWIQFVSASALPVMEYGATCDGARERAKSSWKLEAGSKFYQEIHLGF